jgi:nucleotide-binding universal stress UspA family protein
MFAHILIAADGTELSDKAVHEGVALAKLLGAKLTAIHVTEPWTTAVSGEWAVAFPVKEYEEVSAANARHILAKVTEEATRAGVSCETMHVPDQFAAEGIVEAATARGCDLIVMASHGRRGFARFLLGSQASRVLTQSAVPVLIIK